MARKKHPVVSADDKETVGAVLRELRRAAGYRSVQAVAATAGCPALRQTIYAYERGGLVPSLPQFLDLVEFYVLGSGSRAGAKHQVDLRAQGVAAVARAMTLPAYHVSRAWNLIERMQPAPGMKA